MAETGHAKNVANFETMISFVTGYGGDYKPSNAAIALAQLTAALASAQAMIDGVTTGLIGWKVQVNSREGEFQGIGKFMTRLSASYAACGAPTNAIEDMKGFARKVKGARKGKIEIDDPNTPENEAAHNSVSQRSYTQVVEHFDAAIELCMNTPQFNPNEADLTVAAMQAKSAAMKVANTNVTNSVTTLSNNRISRDEVLYTDATSIFELARLVKLYVKSLYGQGSPQYKQISGLKFTKPRGL
ncbi:MAG TPA: hypothetical protein PKA82_06145 [Pyrinomonadaceae bacterium]|nr:hypothetical protein [Pyrinomonadaceae bacterium]